MEVIVPENSSNFTLPELQKCVGGYIETVPDFESPYRVGLGSYPLAYCNEEGLVHGLASNPKASEICGLPLVGNILLLKVSTDGKRLW